MALYKPAWQSSISHQGFARHAVDGNRSVDTGVISCSVTVTQNSPWWIVDLQLEYEIVRVVVTQGEGGKHYITFIEALKRKVEAF